MGAAKKFFDRWYQNECADALASAIIRGDCNPVAATPTGSGKSVILCKTVEQILEQAPSLNVLVLSHVQEIIEQDYKALRDYFEWDDDDEDYLPFSLIGVYSAGLDRKEIKKVTVAGIQSAHVNPELFSHFDVVLIDECHLINNEDAGMYRRFLKKIDAVCAGLTATPFRTKGGLIYEGEGTLFDCIVYDLTSRENFVRLIDEGYLCRIHSKPAKIDDMRDTKGIRTVGGDYSTTDLSKKFDHDPITEKVVDEVISVGEPYKRWLFFAIDTHHAERIAHFLNAKGIPAIAIHSKMDEDRKEAMEMAKSGKYRALVTVNILTTGYDDPNIDLIAILRHTKSPIIHVQGPGRGLRPVYAEGYDLSTIEGRLAAQAAGPKPHCLVLDFVGNFRRLGPINDVKLKGKKRAGGSGSMVKDCPECGIENHLSAKVCEFCGHEFPQKEKVKPKFDESAEVVREVRKKRPGKHPPKWYTVESARLWVKERPLANLKDSFRVTYICEGGAEFTEMVNLDSLGYDVQFAKYFLSLHWDHSHGPVPKTVRELADRADGIKIPYALKVDTTGRYPRFTEKRFLG